MKNHKGITSQVDKLVRRAPCECSTFKELCELRTDNHSLKDFWIISDEKHITLTKQKDGESPTETITIPKYQFKLLVSWYQKKQEIVKRA